MSTIRTQALWTLLATAVNAVVQMSKLVLLARALDPAGLGVYAIVVAISMLLLLLQDFGLSSFFVQRKFVSQRIRTALFFLSLTLGMAVTVLMTLLALLLGWWYESPLLGAALLVLSLNYVMLGCASQFQASLIRERQLQVLAMIEVLASVLSLAVFLLLYHLEWQLHAYVVSVLAFSLAKLVLLVLGSSWRPPLCWSRLQLLALLCQREAMTFGAYQLGGQLLNHLRSRLDVILLGKISGLDLMGIYGLAKETVMRPQGLFQPVVSRVALPVLVQYRYQSRSGKADSDQPYSEEPDRMFGFYLQAVRKIAWLHAALFALLIVMSPWVVGTVYDKQSPLAVELIRVLSIFAFLRSIGMPIGALTQSVGKTQLDLRWNALALVFNVMPLVLAIYIDLLRVSVAMTAVQFLLTNMSYWFVIRPCVADGVYHRFVAAWCLPFAIVLLVYGVCHAG